MARAGHVGDAASARAGLVDSAPIVRSTALGALERLGSLGDDDLFNGLHDDDPTVRRRAAELTATHPGADLLPTLDDPDASVVEMAAWSAGEREEVAAVDRLARMATGATGHTDPLCREAAVAALGAIGDPSGLPAVLAALVSALQGKSDDARHGAALALQTLGASEANAALIAVLKNTAHDSDARSAAALGLGFEHAVIGLTARAIIVHVHRPA